MITAKGKRFGKTIIVEYNDGKWLFDQQPNTYLEDEIKRLLQRRPLIGGTFVAPTVDDIRNTLNVVENWFFDTPVIAECDEYVEPLPHSDEEGVIY